MKNDLKDCVAVNVRALLDLRPREKGVARLIHRGIANGNAQRILGGETSFGLDLLEQLAHALRVDAWQLCLPGLDPAHLPALAGQPSPWPFERIAPPDFTALPVEVRQAAEALLLAARRTTALDADAQRLVMIYSRIPDAHSRRIARALMEQFVEPAPEPPAPEPNPAPAAAAPAPPAARRAARTEKRGP